MAALAEPTTTAEVRALHDRLTRFVYANFHRKLSFEEASDAAAEALGEADRAQAAGQRIVNLNAWLSTAAWRNAVSLIRRIEGEGRRKRLRPVDVSEQGEWLLDESDLEDEILTQHTREAEREALAEVWAQLKADEQRALYLRYFDEMPVDEVLGILGCSRHHYENLTKRGLRKLREALIAGVRDEACRACRTAIVDAKLVALDDADVARRDAHLSSCLACRAFQRRQRGLIAVLPLPAAGLLDRMAARLHGIVGGAGDLTHPGEAAAGSVALAGAGATAGAAGASGAAGGLLSIGGAAKTLAVLCSAGAATAGLCATTGNSPQHKPKPRVARAVASDARPAPPVVGAATTATPRPTPPTLTHATRPRPPVAPPTSAVTRRRQRIEARAREDAARKASSPFLPESAAPAPAPARRSPMTTTFSARNTPAAPPAGAPTAAAPSRTAFSQEFTP
ncbi:MAG TPA: sigma-70 family RNA polymerase sigma factor [Solirubrobacteraceae bacterium]|jgi:RNA polymerase sigma factor (sigma-70 family)